MRKPAGSRVISPDLQRGDFGFAEAGPIAPNDPPLGRCHQTCWFLEPPYKWRF